MCKRWSPWVLTIEFSCMWSNRNFLCPVSASSQVPVLSLQHLEQCPVCLGVMPNLLLGLARWSLHICPFTSWSPSLCRSIQENNQILPSGGWQHIVSVTFPATKGCLSSRFVFFLMVLEFCSMLVKPLSPVANSLAVARVTIEGSLLVLCSILSGSCCLEILTSKALHPQSGYSFISPHQ